MYALFFTIFVEINSNFEWKVTSDWTEVIANCKSEVQIAMTATVKNQNQHIRFSLIADTLKTNRTYVMNQGFYLSSDAYALYQFIFDKTSASGAIYYNGVKEETGFVLNFAYR